MNVGFIQRADKEGAQRSAGLRLLLLHAMLTFYIKCLGFQFSHSQPLRKQDSWAVERKDSAIHIDSFTY